MTFLPIVERELLVRARQGRTHWMRVIAAGVAAFFSLQFFLLMGRAFGGNLAQQAGFAFQTLSWVGFILACSGCLLTADSLSSERREGTLGLLLLTRVGTLDVLSGKLAAHGLAAVFALVALTPALMLPVLAGGVVWGQVTRTVLALFSMLVFSLCLGLWTSSGSQRLSESLKRATVWFVVIVGAPLLISILLTYAGGAFQWAAFYRFLSPAGAFVEVSFSAGTPRGTVQLLSLCVGPGYGALFLLLAVRTLRRNARGGVLDEQQPIVEDHAQGKPQLVSDNDPLEWLLRRDRRQLTILWTAAGMNLLIILPSLVISRIGGSSLMGIVYAAQFGSSIASAALYAYAGARFPLATKESAMLELLQTTTVGGAGLLARLWSVLRARLMGPLALAVGLVVFQRLGQLLFLGRMAGSGLNVPVLQLLVIIASVILDAAALCALGVYFGWRSRGIASAVLWPLGLVWGLDLLLSYSFYGLWAALTAMGGFPYMWLSFVSMLVLPALTGVKQIWLIVWARRRLKAMFSGQEFEPFDLRAGIRTTLDRVRRLRHWTPSG